MPSSVEVDVFATPYASDPDLPSGFADRRREEEMSRSRRHHSGPLHRRLPDGHPDRDETGGANRWYPTESQRELIKEGESMSGGQKFWWAACTAAGALGLLGMAAYAAYSLGELGERGMGTGSRVPIKERVMDLPPPPEAVAGGGRGGGGGGGGVGGGGGLISTVGGGGAALVRSGPPAVGFRGGIAPEMNDRPRSSGVLRDSTSSAASIPAAAIPENIDVAFVEITDPYDSTSGMDGPFFWHVPLTGGNAVEGALGSCMGLVQASDVGCTLTGGGGDDPCEDDNLRVVSVYGESYVNVDTTSPSGLRRAVGLRLVPSGLADVIHSPLPHPASYLFIDPAGDGGGSSHPRGRMFAMFRHPADRAAATYRYLSESRDRPADFPPAIEEYATSRYVENNMLTRLLVYKPKGGLTEYDVREAQEVLRRKCLVGLYERAADSLGRYASYFDVPSRGGEKCVAGILESERRRFDSHQKLDRSTLAYRLLMDHNRYDIEVYRYAEMLYEYQGRELFGEA